MPQLISSLKLLAFKMKKSVKNLLFLSLAILFLLTSFLPLPIFAFTTCTTDADCGGEDGSCTTYGEIVSCFDSSGNEAPDFIGVCPLVACPSGYTCQTRPAGNYCSSTHGMAVCPEGQERGEDGRCQVIGTPEKIKLENPLGGGEGITSVPRLIGNIIKTILTIVGALALAMFVYGGFTWLTSGGSAEKIQSGKKIIIWAVIGLVIIFASYTLVDFLLTAFGLQND
jgi:hypothetical protein